MFRVRFGVSYDAAMDSEERRDTQEVLNDAAKQRLRASSRVAMIPALTWEEYEVFTAGLEAIGEVGLLRDEETPFEPVVIHTLLTVVREAQLSIEHSLLVAPSELGAERERRRGLRRRADRRDDLEAAILGDVELDEHDRAALMALYRALRQRPRAAAAS